MTTHPFHPGCPLCDTWRHQRTPEDLTNKDLHSAFVLGAFVGLCLTGEGRSSICTVHLGQLRHLNDVAIALDESEGSGSH